MEIMRHELKHVIHTGDYLAIKNRLKWIMKSDQHVNSSGQYKIRSLYFDNYRDKALIEKLSGISEREKFRLRYYNDDCQFVNLEKKSKKKSTWYKSECSLDEGRMSKNFRWRLGMVKGFKAAIVSGIL